MTISATALERFDAWKAGDYDEPPGDEGEDDRDDGEPPPTGIKPR